MPTIEQPITRRRRPARLALCVAAALALIPAGNTLAQGAGTSGLLGGWSFDRPLFRKPKRAIESLVDGFLWIDAEDFTDYGGWW